MKRITYCYDNTGMVYSRVGSEIAAPVLQYEKIGKGGDFKGPMEYKLERFHVFSLAPVWSTLIWTRKISKEIKNRHRKFWGMKPLT